MKAIFVGPEKTATSWIDEFLRDQSQLTLPGDVKETFFFDRFFKKGRSWYDQHFDGAEETRVEVAPSYFRQAIVAERIASLFPNVHIVISLREPLNRTVSMYHHLKAKGWTNKAFRESVERDEQLLSGSLYAAGIQNWRTHFPNPQIHLVTYEEFQTSPKQFVERIGQILELENVTLSTSSGNIKVNQRRSARSPLLSLFIRKASYTLRTLGAYRTINVLRSLGVGRLVWRESQNEQISNDDLHWLAQILASDTEQLYLADGIDYRNSLSNCKQEVAK